MTSQAELDRILTTWMADGPVRAPEWRVRAALADVAGTSQKRVLRVPRLEPPRDRSAPPAALFATIAVALLAVVSLGIGLGSGLIGLPTLTDRPAPMPTPSDSPESDASTDGLIGYRYPEAGFEIALPVEWRVTSESDDAALTARTETSHLRLFISSGDSTGRIATCQRPAAPWESCGPHEATDRASLASAIAILPRDDHGVGPPSARLSQVELGGEPATLQSVVAYEYPPQSGQAVSWVVAMHDGRPFVVRLSWSVGREIPDVPSILSTFRFLDESSPSAWQDLGLELFTNSRDGYEVAVPSEWSSDPPELAGDGSSVAFGSGRGAGTHGSPALRITVGEPDGTIHLCGSCTDRVRSLDQFEDLLVSTPSFFTTGPDEQHGDLVVANEPARYEKAGIGNDCLGCPGAYYHVYFIHDGRPVVLAFDYWTVRFRSMVVSPGQEIPFTGAMLEAMLASFRFADQSDEVAPLAPGSGNYQVTLPATWTEVQARAPGVREWKVSDGSRSRPVLRIAFERDDGILDLCVVRCATFGGVEAIDDLSRAIHDPAVAHAPVDSPYGPVVPRNRFLVREDTVLGGEPARMESPDPAKADATLQGEYEHVFAVHEGRAVVISFDFEAIRRGRISDQEIADILESFEFTDG